MDLDGIIDLSNDFSEFAYDGETVTYHFFAMRAGPWASPDGYYRSRTKWVGKDLHVKSEGTWRKVASFNDGRFENEVNGVRLRFRKITGAALNDEYYEPLRRKRPIGEFPYAAWEFVADSDVVGIKDTPNPTLDLLPPPQGFRISNDGKD